MNTAFTAFSSPAIQLPMKDIDTDIIIPAQFLKITTKTGLGKNVFYNLRNNENGDPNPEFPMNRPEFSEARIVVAGKNFGCGSSREHAPWALKDAGIDVVISSEFADIFKGNTEKNGVLPIVLEEEEVQKILSCDALSPLSVDLKNQTVEMENGEAFYFSIDDFTKRRFLENMSDLDYLLDLAPKIRAFETERKKSLFIAPLPENSIKITLVCAMGEKNEIGEKNSLLWDLPEDMKHFRTRTAGGVVVMGRKTFESIGMPLPKRRNIVLSRSPHLEIEGAEVFSDIQKMISVLENENIPEIFVIGGANIYAQFLPLATHLSLTFVHQKFPNADAFFPEISDVLQDGTFTELSRRTFPKDSHHNFGFDICEFERKEYSDR